MTPETFRRIEKFFHRAMALPAGESKAFLDAECPSDEEVRAEVEKLLAQADPEETLEVLRASVDQVLRPKSDDASSDSIGPAIEGYQIIREIHRGGQGVVYQATQSFTRRKVAIKVLLEGPYASKSAERRFEREIELVASLKHPNIISIFHSGKAPDGRQYYVMDYVRGVPIHHFVRDHKLTIEETLKLFQAVCDAVNYAHQKGVIHRDLKPSNILVNAEGMPKVLDFGLAKMVGGPEETLISVTGQVVGTLPYMSPEQARGNPDEIDIRTDVYALGVVLYEMLTGRYPYPVVGQMADVLKHIAETAPTPPSQNWTSDSGVTKRSGKRLRVGQCPIDDEVQTIVLRTLAKDRERRYQSAGELRRDIGHYLANEPIEAKRDSGWYVFRKKLRRHRTAAAAGVVFALLLGTFGLYMYRSAVMTEADRLYARGKNLFNDHDDPTAAFARFHQAIELNPGHYQALFWIGYLKKKEYFADPFNVRRHKLLEDAKSFCDRSLEIADKSAAWNLKSAVLYSLGELADAERASRRALKLEPDNHYAASVLAKILALQGRFDEALETVRQGAAMESKQEKHAEIDDGVWRTLGTLQLQLGRGEALESLQRAKEIHKVDARNRLMLARLYMTMPEHLDNQLALTEAKNADLYFKLDDPRCHRVLAQALLRNGELRDVAGHAQAAISGGDEAAYAHLIWAIAEARLGNGAAAKEQVAAAVEKWPRAFDKAGVAVIAEKGLLWFDTAAELEALRREAEQLISNLSN